MTNPIIMTNDAGCSSFELRKTTRGYTWNIKIYHSDIKEGYQLAKQIDHQATNDYGQITEEE